MIKELEQVVDWQPLLIYIGMEKYVTDKIKTNYPGDTDGQKREAFDKWLRQNQSACWKDIIDALYELKECVLARMLTRKYEWKDPRVLYISSYCI